ncbi:MAG: polysaccharide deacetylase family protein, partial [Eubacteriales bacterium]|nr:polysaccharide deacetylase family protein [Eubacteriales bacterium]
GYRMEAATGMRPTSLLYRQGAPTDSLLKAAGACYFTEVVVPAQSVGAQTFTSAEEAAALVGDMKKQEILCIRLTAVRSQMAHVTEWVLQAMAAGNLGSQAQRLVEANAGALSEPLTRVYTTEEAVGYTFTGLGNDVELMNLLSSLKALSAKCVFFVSPAEIEGSEGSIRQIQQAGHDLGLCVNAADYASADKLLETLLEARDALQKNYGCTDVSLVSQSYGAPGDLLKEAASAGGFTLVSYTIDAVRSSDQRATDASAVIAALFGNDTSKLQRGMIIHFQMNQYSQSNTLLGELARTLSAQRSLYALHSVADMLANRDLTYSYPLTEGQILPQLYNRIHPGQLSGSVIQAIQQRYIGTDWVDSKKMLPGFTSEEIKTLDKTGIIKNNSNQVFLTFDDWGSDEAINDILKVLKAHNAKATFFVRTGNVHYNPNLLRAIAMEGHAIASHTDSHFALSNDTTGAGKVFSSLTTAQVAALQTDLVKSWEVLQSIVGDIIVDGKPALTLLFRPPTLAVSKEGLQTVLDCGFTYSVSGFYSSQDYKAKSPEKLASGLASNTKSGSILVMHMSDNSVYTADALELYLTKMELRPVSKQYRFVRLDEAL